MDQISARVTGRVQRVFFRQETQKTAESLNVTGWVQNNSDGSVGILAQGEKEALESLIRWCRSGPPHAQVDNLEVVWEKPTETFKTFTVKKGHAPVPF